MELFSKVSLIPLKKATLVVGLGLAVFGQTAIASTEALSIGGGLLAPWGAGNPVNLGFSFTAQSNLSVDSLGAYFTGESSTSGAAETVTLYDANTRAVIASTTVSDATPGTAGYVFSSISPVSLIAGSSYLVSVNTSGNSWGWSDSNSPVTDLRISLGSTSYAYGGVAYPTDNYEPTKAYYGANLTISAVPEPETYAMMLAGLAGLGFIARRRKI